LTRHGVSQRALTSFTTEFPRHIFISADVHLYVFFLHFLTTYPPWLIIKLTQTSISFCGVSSVCLVDVSVKLWKGFPSTV
jgi:hypothetical protein